MKKYQKEIIKITSKEVLLSFLDLAMPFFHANRIYRQPINSYFVNRRMDRSELLERIRHLKKMGFIQSFTEGKEEYIELTGRGIKRLEKLSYESLKISKPEKWDKKWRLVIFDIPADDRAESEQFRRKLLSLGFIKIQGSVYTHPFECTTEIDFITSRLNISHRVIIFIASAIRNEEKIIEKFFDQDILKKSDLT